MPGDDSNLLGRLSIVIVAAFALFAGFTRVHRLYSHKFLNVTGRAQWIWAPVELPRENPVAFFATRDFQLPPNRAYTHIKVLGDPEYTLFFNGKEVGGRRAGEEGKLDVYDVTPLATTGANRIVVALRSTNGVGGLLASVDLAPENENVVPTGPEWHVAREWAPDILRRDPPDTVSPMLLGDPPTGRWNYLSPAAAAFDVPPRKVIPPQRAFTFKTALAQVKVVSGVAITSLKGVRATAYDFGFTRGRLRLTRTSPSQLTRVVTVRFANVREELFATEGPVHSFVFAPHEPAVADPETRSFRYALVYGGEARADVLQ